MILTVQLTSNRRKITRPVAKHKSVRHQTYTKSDLDDQIIAEVFENHQKRYGDNLSMSDFLMGLVRQEHEWIKREPRFSRNAQVHAMTKMMWSQMCLDKGLDVDSEWEKLLLDLEKLDSRR